MLGKKTRKIKELKREIARFKGQYDEEDVAIVMDANVPLYYVGRKPKEGFAKYLDKLEGVVFIPWPVYRELRAMWLMPKKEEKIREEGSQEELERLEEFLSELSGSQKRMRRIRGERALFAFPFVEEKIQQGKWKLTGSDPDIEPYLKGLNKKIEERIKKADMKILATCLFLADKHDFKDVFLWTRDKKFAEEADKWGIKTTTGISSLIRNLKN